MKNTLIVIPARYSSTRLPGKPLKDIQGQTMIQRVIEIALKCSNVSVMVATDDDRIYDFVTNELKHHCVMTPNTCKSGSDRVFNAIKSNNLQPDMIINLQGDVPLLPSEVIQRLIENFYDKDSQVITPVVNLSWQQIDELKEYKQSNPFSGTLCATNNDQAFWFSKNIIPAMRKENRENVMSPYYKHIGVYGYSYKALETFVSLPPSHYEELEGLEQLRFIEALIPINTVDVSDLTTNKLLLAVDTEQDLALVNKELSNGNKS